MTRKEEIENAAREYTKKWYKDLGVAPEDYPTDAKITIHEFIKGAEWADRTMLNKVYDFIIANVYKYGKVKFVDNRATFDFRMNTFLNDLKQAMEE